MKIGVDSDVIENLISATENTEYYLQQLAREGHDVKTITEGKECGNLDLYITSKPTKLTVPDGVAKNFLLFPDQVSTWWEIYNHIRYEL